MIVNKFRLSQIIFVYWIYLFFYGIEKDKGFVVFYYILIKYNYVNVNRNYFYVNLNFFYVMYYVV